MGGGGGERRLKEERGGSWKKRENERQEKEYRRGGEEGEAGWEQRLPDPRQSLTTVRSHRLEREKPIVTADSVPTADLVTLWDSPEGTPPHPCRAKRAA